MHFTKEQLPKVAEGLAEYLKKNQSKDRATILALEGDLGSGKTALVQQVAVRLGVEQVPPSPTFVIMRSYVTRDAAFSKLIHIDAYRIEHEDELRPLHLENSFSEKGALVCIEWPEKLWGSVPKEALKISLETLGEKERELNGPADLLVYLQNLL